FGVLHKDLKGPWPGVEEGAVQVENHHGRGPALFRGFAHPREHALEDRHLVGQRGWTHVEATLPQPNDIRQLTRSPSPGRVQPGRNNGELLHFRKAAPIIESHSYSTANAVQDAVRG